MRKEENKNKNVNETAPLLPPRSSLSSSPGIIRVKSQEEEEDEVWAQEHHMSSIGKSLDSFSSFALITNNISGPGMMSLPIVFITAGYIPAISCILLVCFSSSITGGLFSQAISEIPGNSKFNKNITYATAFRLLIDPTFATIAERIFILACFIQCSAGIVQAAQSLDSFIASYLLGNTYGIQIYPTIQFITWSESLCQNGLNEIDILQNCVPFFANGPLIITLGYVVIVCLFLPLGLRNLKETMIVQLISFFFLVLVMIQFNYEFISVGLTSTIPAFGSDLSQLVGVVLFNFDYVITLPAWLIEKKVDVNPNTVIWSTASFCSILYIIFGFLGARAFGNDSEKMMALLESNEVPVLTKWCAALFGVCIIGAGVPVFSVIIKNTLFATKICDAHKSFFFGSIFPYCFSWVIYQGHLVTDLLNWAGLIVNGLIAFVFPIALCYYVFVIQPKRRQSLSNDDNIEEPIEMNEFTEREIQITQSPRSSRIPESPPHAALMECLLPYRTIIISFIFILFLTMITTTVVVNLLTDL